jgi:hypothetical protein
MRVRYYVINRSVYCSASAVYLSKVLFMLVISIYTVHGRSVLTTSTY